MAKPLFFKSVDEVQQKVAEYFQTVEDSRREFPLKNGSVQVRYEKPATMIGLAVWLHIRKDVLYDWMEYRERQGKLSEEEQNRITDILRDARDRIEAMTVERAAANDYEPKIATLILNGFGYSKQDDQRAVLIKIEGAGNAEVEDWSK